MWGHISVVLFVLWCGWVAGTQIYFSQLLHEIKGNLRFVKTFMEMTPEQQERFREWKEFNREQETPNG